jgi:hypothetical protein
MNQNWQNMRAADSKNGTKHMTRVQILRCKTHPKEDAYILSNALYYYRCIAATCR